MVRRFCRRRDGGVEPHSSIFLVRKVSMYERAAGTQAASDSQDMDVITPSADGKGHRLERTSSRRRDGTGDRAIRDQAISRSEYRAHHDCLGLQIADEKRRLMGNTASLDFSSCGSRGPNVSGNDHGIADPTTERG
jgi:hypothetical protein